MYIFDPIASGSHGTFWWPGDPSTKFNSKQAAVDHMNNVKAARNKAAGREVTDAEHVAGRLLNRADSRSAKQIEMDRMFSVKPATDQLTRVLDTVPPSAKYRPDQAPSLSSNDRLRASIKLEQNKRAEREEIAQAKAEHLADPHVAGALARLRAVQAKMAFDPSFSEEQVVAVEHALMAWSEPLADRLEAQKLLRIVLGADAANHEAKFAAYSESVSAATAALEALKANAPSTENLTVAVSGTSLGDKGNNLIASLMAGGAPHSQIDRAFEAMNRFHEGDASALAYVLAEHGGEQ